MIEMTLSSRHRIRNSSPGGLRPSTLPLGHGGSPQYWLSHVDGEETFLFLWNRRDWEPNPELWLKGSGANHYPRAPALRCCEAANHRTSVILPITDYDCLVTKYTLITWLSDYTPVTSIRTGSLSSLVDYTWVAELQRWLQIKVSRDINS